jgi:hypothetical protein
VTGRLLEQARPMKSKSGSANNEEACGNDTLAHLDWDSRKLHQAQSKANRLAILGPEGGDSRCITATRTKPTVRLFRENPGLEPTKFRRFAEAFAFVRIAHYRGVVPMVPQAFRSFCYCFV